MGVFERSDKKCMTCCRLAGLTLDAFVPRAFDTDQAAQRANTFEHRDINDRDMAGVRRTGEHAASLGHDQWPKNDSRQVRWEARGGQRRGFK